MMGDSFGNLGCRAGPPQETGSVGAHTLWLVRHAQPVVDPGICYGQLNVAAEPEATRLCAIELARILPKGITVITSMLQRCEQLALVLIGVRPDLYIKTDPRLQEMHFGKWEGRAWADIPKTELDAWTTDFSGHRAGESGESVAAFMSRVTGAFDALPIAGDTLWITHAGVIRAATLLAAGIRQPNRADQWPMNAPAYGQWCTLTLQRSPANGTAPRG